MKILFVPDVKEWAIGKLVKAKSDYLSQHGYECHTYAVHPREAQQQASSFYAYVDWLRPDIIVYEYYRSAEQLVNAKEELKQYKSVLVHHNQRDKALYHADWNELGIDRIVTHTSTAKCLLEDKGYTNVEVINHGIDFDYFTYDDTEPAQPKIGYVGRIVPWKRLADVARAGEELGYPVQVMGKIDKPDYWDGVPKENLDFSFYECGDNERINAYRNVSVYVGFSDDGYEEGTLPLLEAMASGVPVVSTPNGVAADILKDEDNALVVDFGDYEGMKAAVSRVLTSPDLRKKLRKNAWQTVKNMPQEKMAYRHGLLYNDVVHGLDNLVSVVIPATSERFDEVATVLSALDKQTHGAFEAIVVWDEAEMPVADLGDHDFTVKQYCTHEPGYGLAKARNVAAIEAEGKYLMFCDSRLKPDPNAIQLFLHSMGQVKHGNNWLFGEKGGGKATFVENFSFVEREKYIRFGMLCERMDRYGGLTQEIRTRWTRQGGDFLYVPSVEAEQVKGSKMTQSKRRDIVNSKFKLLKMYGEN